MLTTTVVLRITCLLRFRFGRMGRRYFHYQNIHDFCCKYLKQAGFLAASDRLSALMQTLPSY